MLIQITAIIAALMGIVGLGVDVGFTTLERRMLQNAVDAAAVSGARDLVEPIVSGGTSTYNTAASVSTMATKNNIPVGTSIICEYVDNADTVTGPCSSPPLNGSSGVRVTGTHTRENLFMKVLGIPTVTVSAQATARAQAMTSYQVGKSLFIVCGFSTFTYKHAETGGKFVPNPSQEYSILETVSTNPPAYNVRDGAYGKWYIIHDEQVQDAACGYTNSGFKGLLDDDQEGYVALDHTLLTLEIDTGTKAGPTRYAVDVEYGCKVGTNWDADPKGCLMMVPVAVSSPANKHLDAWTWLPFLIVQGDYAKGNNPYYPELNVGDVGSNSHVGKLLRPNEVHKYDPAATYGTWSVGIQAGPVVVQLSR